MRANLNQSVKASYEMIRDMAQAVAGDKHRTFRGTNDTFNVTVLYSPTFSKFTVMFAYRNIGNVHTRTSHNAATACNTLAALGFTSFDMLTQDQKGAI